MKVLVIGAGPTGLTAGVELARAGIDVIIIDKKPTGSTLSRAVGINPRSLKILEASGVTGKLLAEGIKLKTANFFKGTDLWGKLHLDSAEPIQYDYNFMLGLPQDRTEEILRDKFQSYGGSVKYDTDLVDFQQNSTGITATTTSGEQFKADYLLGADGIQSTTRQLLGMEFNGISLPEAWSIADIETENLNFLEEGVGLYALEQGKVIFIAPIGKSRYRFVSNTENVLKELPFKLNITTIHREGKFNIKIAQVKNYQKGSVFLAGDAAHCHSPVGGRGMNLGISDASDFTNKLIYKHLHDYTASRYLEGRTMIQGSELLRKLITSKSQFKYFTTLACLKVIFNTPALQKRVASKFLYG